LSQDEGTCSHYLSQSIQPSVYTNYSNLYHYLNLCLLVATADENKPLNFKNVLVDLSEMLLNRNVTF